jgi:hypothetical protein
MKFLKQIGQPKLVGSVPVGLIVKKDIDIHVLVKPDQQLEKTLTLITKLIVDVTNKITLMRFRRSNAYLSRITLEDQFGDEWTIEIWITSNPNKMGEVRNDLKKLTDQQKKTILFIKDYYHQVGLNRWGLSTLIYNAVTYHQIKSRREFIRYLKSNPDCTYPDIITQVLSWEKSKKSQKSNFLMKGN